MSPKFEDFFFKFLKKLNAQAKIILFAQKVDKSDIYDQRIAKNSHF
jgi:hypothetical protein